MFQNSMGSSPSSTNPVSVVPNVAYAPTAKAPLYGKCAGLSGDSLQLHGYWRWDRGSRSLRKPDGSQHRTAICNRCQSDARVPRRKRRRLTESFSFLLGRPVTPIPAKCRERSIPRSNLRFLPRRKITCMVGETEGKTSATSPLPPCGEVDVSVASHSRNSR